MSGAESEVIVRNDLVAGRVAPVSGCPHKAARLVLLSNIRSFVVPIGQLLATTGHATFEVASAVGDIAD